MLELDEREPWNDRTGGATLEDADCPWKKYGTLDVFGGDGYDVAVKAGEEYGDEACKGGLERGICCG